VTSAFAVSEGGLVDLRYAFRLTKTVTLAA
jgi:hypothetical protein